MSASRVHEAVRIGIASLLVAVAASACESREAPQRPFAASSSARPPLTGAATAAPNARPSRCSETVATTELAPGLRLERRLAPILPSAGAGDRCVTLVRIDTTRFKLVARSAPGNGLTAEAWSKREGLWGVINASMFLSDGKSVGLLQSRDGVVQPRDDSKLGGFLAFDPARDGLREVAAFGRDCAGFDLTKVRRDYHAVIQNYRLLDCDARAIRWRDPKVYSAAAVGTGRDGSVVFIHSRTPYAMADFATILADPALGLSAAMFVEGGPEATLYVHAGGAEVVEVGSFETGFREDDANHAMWELPNVIGFLPR